MTTHTVELTTEEICTARDAIGDAIETLIDHGESEADGYDEFGQELTALYNKLSAVVGLDPTEWIINEAE